jgi:positive regulator of sigma E activity
MELVESDPCGLLQDQEDGQFACRTCRSEVQCLQPVPVRAGMERTLPERSENSQSLRGGQKWALSVR